MDAPVQKRAVKTRARLTDAARTVVSESGYEAMRVEEVVARAGVAKGTFFAHFKDKDALMDQLIGAEIDHFLDEIERKPAPVSIADMVAALTPLCVFMSSERYVFDVIIRYSGAAAIENIGPIAKTFERQILVIAAWLERAPFRKDVSAYLLAEGVQAFIIQALALKFCAIHQETAFDERLQTYLAAWLMPKG